MTPNDLLFFALTILLFSSPFGQGGEDVGAIFRLNTLIFAMFSLWLISVAVRMNRIRLCFGFERVLGLVLALCVISYLKSPYRYSTQIELTQIFLYVFLLYLILNVLNEKKISLIMNWILFLCLLQAVVCLYQYYIDDHPRPAGLFFNPNLAATFMLSGFAIALSSLFKHSQARLWRVVYGASCLILVWGFLSTGSRSLGLAAIPVVFCFILLRWRRILPAVGLALAALILILAVPNPVKERLLHEDDSDIYAMDRPKIWSKSLRIIGDHPYFGVTLGNFEYSTFKYRFPVENTVGRFAKIFKDPHNSYLEIGAELGILGVIGILSILFLLTRCCMRTYKKTESADEKHDLIASFLILIGLAVQGCFHDVTHSPPNILFGLVALASVGYYHANYFEKESGNRRRLIPVTFLEKFRIKRTFLIFAVLVWVVICWPAFCLKVFVSHNYYQSAMTVYALGDLSGATKNLEKAIYYNPMQPFYFRLMGDIHMQTYERTGDPEELKAAEAAFSKSISLNRVNPSFYFTLGNYYYFIKETSREDTLFAAKAVQEFKKAVASSPFDIKYRMRLVSLYMSIGKNHEAVKELEACVNLEPNFVTARHLLSILYGRMGEDDRSREMKESIHAIRRKYRHYVPTKKYEELILMEPEEYAQRRFTVPLNVEKM